MSQLVESVEQQQQQPGRRSPARVRARLARGRNRGVRAARVPPRVQSQVPDWRKVWQPRAGADGCGRADAVGVTDHCRCDA